MFRKLKFQIHPHDIAGIIKALPGNIERVLFLIYSRIRKIEQEKEANESSLEGRNAVISAESKINSQISARLVEKEETIQELRGTVEILYTKMKRMEELNRLKDSKIESLIRKLEEGVN